MILGAVGLVLVWKVSEVTLDGSVWDGWSEGVE